MSLPPIYRGFLISTPLGGGAHGRGSLWEGKLMGGEAYGRGSLWEGKLMGREAYGRGSAWERALIKLLLFRWWVLISKKQHVLIAF